MTSGRPKLWRWFPAIATQERVDKLGLARKPGIAFLNDADIDVAMFGPPDEPLALAPGGVELPFDHSTLPTPRLRVVPADFFMLTLPFVSERLARTLAPDDAQLFDVDCSDCPPAAQAMGYKVLNVRARADPIDRDLTGPGRFVDVDAPTGPTFAWVRPRPPHPNDLAERVAGARFADVGFYDQTNDGTRTTLAMRPVPV